ncbi:MAG: LLM class flavin-dependent oxidoreductase [Burkholderiales bacterium]
MPAEKKPIRFNAFIMNTVGHQSPGLWTHPEDRSADYRHTEYWTELARLLEGGLFDGIFIADVMGVYDVYGSGPDTAIRHAVQIPTNDPMLVIPVMAAATRHLGYGVTFSLTYEHPYPFARRMSTLDHLTKGRVGWNIVTGYLESAAKNLGMPAQIAHDDRYDLAEEYMEVLYKLWECSWEEGAVVRDKRNGIFTDPSKVHPVNHKGRHFTVPGIHLCEPSPQRTPVLYQAGASSRGMSFAGRHAECIFMSGPSKIIIQRYVEGTRAALGAAGRASEDAVIYAQALVVTGRSEAEAKEKYNEYCAHTNTDASLALLSGWTGIDFSRCDPGATLEYVENDAGRTALASFTKSDPNRKWTVREAARFVALGGRGPVFVGSASQVADEMESWVDETGIDGFNLAFAVSPGTFRDIVEYIVPELQGRRRYRTEYSEGTLREKLFRRGAKLPENHVGRKTKLVAP